ncbi:MAG TPA: PDZ domain-containing protein [Nevskiaceae bacterium]|nr:PDZ domain-containing protein [Nevskiaceae bacterium]
MTAPVRYTVVPADPRAHRFRVTCDATAPSTDALVFRLPAWIRGSYLVRDFAKHVFGLRAWRGGLEVEIERIEKSAFRVSAGQSAIRIEYGVHAFDESVRKAFLDGRRGFFNASSLCYVPDGQRDRRCELRLERPPGDAFAAWRVATAMTRTADVDEAGFGTYAAADYEELIDHPFELGEFRRFDIAAGGVPHALVIAGRTEIDAERVTADLAKICEAQREMFGGEPALAEYLFLTNVVAVGYGGLEHRASTALICSRGDIPRPGQATTSREYRGFLGLCSHEYFHLWNVKRITAASFLDNDLSREAYTRDLWHYEGVTSYYDDLFLLRAGMVDVPAYLDLVAENATRLWRSPSRRVQTLEDASFETWIKYYQPDDNTPNAATNYYVKGGLAALCIDLTLRRDTAITLDDVMRELWKRYGRTGIGVPERGLEDVAVSMAGESLREVFDHALRSTHELPIAELLEAFGVRASLRGCTSVIDEGGRTMARGALPWLGLRLRGGDVVVGHVLDGGPAQAAGLSAGDLVVAIDGYKATANNWNRRLEALVPGQPVALHFFRGDELLSCELVPRAAPLDTWTIVLAEDADAAAVERRKRWIGA